MKRSIVFFIILALCLGSGMAQTIKHKFLILVENRDTLAYVDESNPANNWTSSLKNFGKNNDIQLIGNNRVMVSFQDGYGSHPVDKGGFCEFDMANKGALVRDCQGITPGGHETSCQRLLNGNTRLFRNNWDAQQPITCYEFDSSAKNIVKQWQWKDGNTNCIGSRMVRQTSEGTYLFGTTNTGAGCVYEGDSTGKAIKRATVPGVGAGNSGSVYKAIKLQNGNYLTSCGFGKKIVEQTSSGSVVRTLDGSQTPSGSSVSIGQYFYGCFQVLENGNIILCNWRGHGSEPDAHGYALVEYDTNGKVVWTWRDAADKWSCHKILVLDSVDTKYMYYDVYGKLTRMTPATEIFSPALKMFQPSTDFPACLMMSGFAAVTLPERATVVTAYNSLGKKIWGSSLTGARSTLRTIPFPATARQPALLRFSK